MLQDDGLSAFMPKSLGNRNSNEKKAESKISSVAPADDDYEVEELAVDPMMAMMPMSFGKQDKKRDLTASFEKTKRVVKTVRDRSDLQHEKPQPEVTIVQNQEHDDDDYDDDDDDSDDMIGPKPAEAEVEDEDEEGEEEFPISHEIVLKDHTKVFHYHTLFTDIRL